MERDSYNGSCRMLSRAPVTKHAMTRPGGCMVTGGDDQLAAVKSSESDLYGAFGKSGRIGKRS